MARRPFRRALLGLLSLRRPLAVSAAPQECTREALLETVGDYLQGLTMGLAGPLGWKGNVAENFSYMENNKDTDIVMGVMFNIMNLDHNRTIVDLEQCASYTEVIAARPDVNGRTFVLGTQIRQDPADGMNIYLVDSIVSTNGSWFFDASQTLLHARREDWSPPPPDDQRPSRETLRRTADAYLDMWTDAHAAAAVPWGDPCNRLEGSLYVNCTDGIPTNTTQLPNTNRRYVIDESFGSVNVLCSMQSFGNAPDSHEFRLEGGRLRYVHSITVADSSKFNFTGVGEGGVAGLGRGA